LNLDCCINRNDGKNQVGQSADAAGNPRTEQHHERGGSKADDDHAGDGQSWRTGRIAGLALAGG